MKWTKLDNYCLKSGEYYIAKYYLFDGAILYGLSKNNTNWGYYGSADEAKEKAKELENEANIHPSR